MTDLHQLMEAEERVLLVGPPGCGKTARIHDLAKQHGKRLVVMRASLSERVDFGGALVPDMEANITKALPLELLADLQSTTEPTVLFMDDMGQAPMDVQSALMKWFDENELSDQVLIWGATNRPGDVAGVTRLHEALRSRFSLKFEMAMPGTEDRPDGPVLLGTWAEEVDAWCEWALDNGAPPEVIAWHRSTQGKHLYAWKPTSDPAVAMPDYRSWATVIRLWNKGIRDMSTLAGAIGKAPAMEFLSFARLADKLPTPDQVWTNPMGAAVPDDPAALYLVASMLAANVTEQHGAAVVTYLSRMPRVYGAFLARDAYRKLGSKLARSREWVTWFTDNQELFAVGNGK